MLNKILSLLARVSRRFTPVEAEVLDGNGHVLATLRGGEWS